ERFGQNRLFSIIETINRYQTELKYAVQPQMILEVAVLKLCTDDVGDAGDMQWKQELDQLRTTIQRLQQQVADLQNHQVKSTETSVGGVAHTATAPTSAARGKTA